MPSPLTPLAIAAAAGSGPGASLPGSGEQGGQEEEEEEEEEASKRSEWAGSLGVGSGVSGGWSGGPGGGAAGTDGEKASGKSMRPDLNLETMILSADILGVAWQSGSITSAEMTSTEFQTLLSHQLTGQT